MKLDSCCVWMGVGFLCHRVFDDPLVSVLVGSGDNLSSHSMWEMFQKCWPFYEWSYFLILIKRSGLLVHLSLHGLMKLDPGLWWAGPASFHWAIGERDDPGCTRRRYQYREKLVCSLETYFHLSTFHRTDVHWFKQHLGTLHFEHKWAVLHEVHVGRRH